MKAQSSEARSERVWRGEPESENGMAVKKESRGGFGKVVGVSRWAKAWEWQLTSQDFDEVTSGKLYGGQ